MLFPHATLFRGDFPAGAEVQKGLSGARTWQEVAQLLQADAVVTALQLAADAPLSSEEQEMFDEL